MGPAKETQQEWPARCNASQESLAFHKSIFKSSLKKAINCSKNAIERSNKMRIEN